MNFRFIIGISQSLLTSKLSMVSLVYVDLFGSAAYLGGFDLWLYKNEETFFMMRLPSLKVKYDG